MPSGEDLKTAIKVKGLTIEKAATLLDMTRANLYLYINKASLDDSFVKFVNTKLDISLIGEEDYRGKYIALLEKSLHEKEVENENLRQLIKRVDSNLAVVLGNQKTIVAMGRGVQEALFQKITHSPEEKKNLLRTAHNKGVAILKVLNKMDNRVDMGS